MPHIEVTADFQPDASQRQLPSKSLSGFGIAAIDELHDTYRWYVIFSVAVKTDGRGEGDMYRSANAKILWSVLLAATAVVLATTLTFMSSLAVGVKLLAGTLVLIGGNSNPTSAGMSQELGGDPLPAGTKTPIYLQMGVAGQGYLDPTNPASPFYGYNPVAVQWPATIPFSFTWGDTAPFESVQRAGLTAMQAAISAGLAAGGPVEVVGYSSSANVVVQELTALRAAGSPDTDELNFIMIAGMNRPNGGIAERFPGLIVPFINVPLGGSPQTKTAYKVTDISWQYDPISDFPNYPLDVVSDLNSVLAFFSQHSDYYNADVSPTAPRVTPDVTVGNITYVTLAAPTLPLLLPLKALGVPKQLINLVEPVLKVLVDFGYNRKISPATPTPASLAPPLDRWIALPFQLIQAVGQGITDALNPNYGKSAATTTPTTSVVAAATVKPSVQAATPAVMAVSTKADNSAKVVAATANKGKAVAPDADLRDRTSVSETAESHHAVTATPATVDTRDHGAATHRTGGHGSTSGAAAPHAKGNGNHGTSGHGH